MLDDLLVVMPFAELGYMKYPQQLQANPDYGYMIEKGRILSTGSAYAHANADGLLRDALKRDDWSRVLICEHDHNFPPSVFRVHAKATQPIYAAAYVLRNIEEPLPVWYMWDAKRESAVLQDAETINRMLVEAPGIYPVDCVPMGCTSIARSVLERWPADQPFFSSYINPKGATISHDVFFCRIAQDYLGVQPYLDTRLQVSHYVLVEVDVAYFIRWWNMVGAKKAIDRAERDGKRDEERTVTLGAGEVAEVKFKLVTS